MGENDLGVFAGFEGEETDRSGQLEQDVFLNNTVDQLMNLFRTAIDLCLSNSPSEHAN